ncbi:MAG: hypothetical protein ABEJ95_07125 [Candidatus Nanohalobium sp.]
MVRRKGIGYALESIVAVATVFIFVLGGLNIPDNQDWNSFRRQVAADDLTYALKSTGYIDHALSHGETGSMQTAFTTLSERKAEVSGLVSNLPIKQNLVAFYTLPRDRHVQQLDNVSDVSGGCSEDELEQVAPRSEYEVLTNTSPVTGHSSSIYLGDIDPRDPGGNSEKDYDSLWVDNGTRCQFSSSEGPYFLEDIFSWDGNFYDFERVNNEKLHIYKADQAVRIREELEKPVNSVETFASIDMVNFSEVNGSRFNVLVVRTEAGVEDINDGSNLSTVKNFMSEDGSMLVLSGFTDQFQDGGFMDQTGFYRVETGYENPPTGEIKGSFSDSRSSQDVRTYFKGLNGEENDVELYSPGVISNSETTVQSVPSVFQNTGKYYNLSQWNRTNSSLKTVDPDNYPGKPESSCYGTDPDALRYGEIEFPDGKVYGILNAELGTSESYCNSNNSRAIMVDVGRDGDFQDSRDGPYLNYEKVRIADREYAVDVKLASENPGCSEGECIGFTYVGDRHVELVATRSSFPGFQGDRMAVAGYENMYGGQDRKLVASLIHWLRGDKVTFRGRDNPADISTTTVSGIMNRTYIPYEVNLRWSR